MTKVKTQLVTFDYGLFPYVTRTKVKRGLISKNMYIQLIDCGLHFYTLITPPPHTHNLQSSSIECFCKPILVDLPKLGKMAMLDEILSKVKNQN